ncbi:hypothetical protein [Streptomyces sp. P17]|uniref:hypothetical protein n=1 Tax=Streptomyces sp. P17 TaxID=3074716 RepID=UPI0028F41EAC|nr:hypothetical protein [Streptomyces sp. P17]MDT9696921.1 hypothetical protein [Streptomyces sp. P17]
MGSLLSPTSAAAAGPRYKAACREQPGWESAARAAVLAGRPLVEALAESVRPEEAEAARQLPMGGTRPFPEC